MSTGHHERLLHVAPDASARLRVLLCDDHEVFRTGLSAVLRAAPDMRVVGEATVAEQAVELSSRVDAQLALVGQDLGGALDLVETLSRAGLCVVVLSDSRSERDLVDALRAGASGYLTKGLTSARLVESVRAAARGETALDAHATGSLLRYLGGPDARKGHDAAGGPDPSQLTPRQKSVAELVGQGLSNSDIAARLCLSQATVKSHLTVILRRLGLRDRTQLAIVVNRSEGPTST